MPQEIHIGDDTYIEPSIMDGTFARGLIHRDMKAFPVGSFAPPAQMKLIPRSEWSERIKDMEASKSRLSDIRMIGNAGKMIPALDQNDPKYMQTRNPRWGYCWAHSTVGAVTILRAVMNQQYVALSAFAVAYTIKNGKDEGGWGAQSLDFVRDRGVPPESSWPRFDQRMRTASDPCWTEAAKYKITDGWAELGDPQYDRDLTFDQMATCLLNRIPVVTDFNWWGHSVCALDLVETSPGKFGIRILNSWGDSWSDKGMGVLSGQKAIPDGAVAPTNVLAT